IAEWIGHAAKANAQLVIFPELALTGYPPKDLVLKSGFVENNLSALDRLAEAVSSGPPALVGFVDQNEASVGRRLRNAVALLQHGRVAGRFHKSLLPTHDVFDEHRYFETADRAAVTTIPIGGPSIPVGISICEDLWIDDGQTRRLYHRNPMEELAADGARLIVNASASPYSIEKQTCRERLMSSHAAKHGIPIVLVNQVGGNDELLFDGASVAFDAAGHVIARARAFEEDLLIIDLDHSADARIEPYPDPIESVRRALVMGTRDYVEKCGFSDVVLGLSGGIDSAVTAALAAEAIGPDRIHGVAMPSRYSSDHSLKDARALAENLGIELKTLPIQEIHRVVEKELTPHFNGRPPDITEENIQARIRGTILMALSNKFGWLPLSTGNKSELAVGYCTLYGDMCGGLAVINDVPKKMVYELARNLNAHAEREIIPPSTISKPPSAELRPDQHDQQSLPPYEMLDAILQAYVENEESVDQIVERGFQEAVVRDVIRKVDRNEHKRKQAATGLKVTSRAFGVGRRMPIAAHFG
ncbi:MAG: NAD+ synthase, partial [Phycisphaerae bacterium]